MTFLQPIILWGLPLLLVPVVIHLINRLRHRTQPWAAMQFLVSATRSSVSHAKLRQFLILLLRVLAVLMLILFLARPLAGGWLGWALSPAPDVIMILLDRSASMETKLPGSNTTRREQALASLAQAAKQFQDTTHLVLLDSASRKAQELPRAANLQEAPMTGATDTAADMPALFQAAINWLIENNSGTTEIWIASDLQRTDWKPQDGRWKNLIAQAGSLPQKIRVRFLAFNQEADNNLAVTLKEVARRKKGDLHELTFVLELQRSKSAATATTPLSLRMGDTRSEMQAPLEGQATRWRKSVPLRGEKAAGWGSIEAPADANGRDNVAYFVFGPETPVKASVISEDRTVGRFLRLASGVISAAAAESAKGGEDNWSQNTLLVWQSPLPPEGMAGRVRTFVEEGGAVLFMPPTQAAPGQFEGIGWGEIETAPTEAGFHIGRWVEEEGPLAKTDEGVGLPVSQVVFSKRRAITGAKNILAAFEDGTPFLIRQTIGRGEAYFCASLPGKQWSTLDEGPVLVPMIQRLLTQGSRRLQSFSTIGAGELTAAEAARKWTSLDSQTAKDPRYDAGVYRSNERMLAVNRPTEEDEPDRMDLEETQKLFGELPFQMLLDKRGKQDQLQGEVWRYFLVGMLLFLIGEGILIMPRAADAKGGPGWKPAGPTFAKAGKGAA